MEMTLEILRERQSWTLEQKIDHTVGAAEAFINYCREHDRTPYVLFSGGLNIARYSLAIHNPHIESAALHLLDKASADKDTSETETVEQ